MPFSRIKNIILVILIAVNLFLLAIVLPARREELARQETVRSNLQALFAEYGIALDPSLIPEDRMLYPLLLEPDAAMQRAAAEALLGSELDNAEETGRYAAVYTSSRGNCEFAHSGGISAKLSQPLEASTHDLSRAAQRLLDQMDFSCTDVSEPVRQSAGIYTISALQQLGDVPVFSAELTLTYSNSALTAVAGDYFTGGDSAVRAGQLACIGCTDALIAFLNSRDELGWVSVRIDAIEQGYLLGETASASTVRLNPAWQIRTDTGTFFVNGLTGDVSAAE